MQVSTHATLLCVAIIQRHLAAETLNAGDIKKAKEGGVYTCEAFLMKTKKVWLSKHPLDLEQSLLCNTDCLHLTFEPDHVLTTAIMMVLAELGRDQRAL